jgi:hypothetical protein
VHGLHDHVPTITTMDTIAAHDSYVPYVHITTGEHRPLRVHVDQQGAYHPLAPVPAGFIPNLLVHRRVSSEEPERTLLDYLRRFICLQAPEASPRAPRQALLTPPSIPASRIVSPVDIRQPDFGDATDADDADDSSGRPVKIGLSTKTVERLTTKLELKDIADWITDFTAAVGRVDADAHRLLVSPDWQALMGVPPAAWAVNANKRIAAALDSCLDTSGPNVVLLKFALRQADRTDRPGILFSGMDIIEEIHALVGERTLGEIKLSSAAAKKISFELGATLDATRLKGIEIMKEFALKPAIERSVPNALLHEILSKVPQTADPTLKLEFATYEKKLFKTELRGLSPPWSPKELIDNIAVDIAHAPTVSALNKEVASVDLPKPKVQLTSTYKCSNCGAVGEHLNQDCPNKCSDCNFNFCPGARGELCAVLCDQPSSKRSLQNGIGKDLHPFLVGKLDAAWKLKHPGEEVSALEMQADSDSDTEVFGLVIPSA